MPVDMLQGGGLLHDSSGWRKPDSIDHLHGFYGTVSEWDTKAQGGVGYEEAYSFLLGIFFCNALCCNVFTACNYYAYA